MPKTLELPDLRSCKVTLNLTEAEMLDLRKEAYERFPLTVSQAAYQRFILGRGESLRRNQAWKIREQRKAVAK